MFERRDVRRVEEIGVPGVGAKVVRSERREGTARVGEDLCRAGVERRLRDEGGAGAIEGDGKAVEGVAAVGAGARMGERVDGHRFGELDLDRDEGVKAEGGESAEKGKGRLAGGSDSRGAGAKKEKVCRGRDGVGDNYGGEGGRVGSVIYGGHGSEEAYGKADGIVIYGITMKLRP